MNLEGLKDFLEIAKDISEQINKEHVYYNEIFDDFQGLNKGLCRALDGIIDTLDKNLGNNDWVSWWVYECDFGANPMEASSGAGQPLELVDSVDKLYEIIMKEANE